MTALAIQPSALSTQPSVDDATAFPLSASPRPRVPASPWIDLTTAVSRSGLSLRQLRRQCLETWRSTGAAELRQQPGRKPAWYVREDADPRFARVKFPESIGLDLTHISQSKRDQAMSRLQLLQDWEQARKASVSLGFNEAQITAQFCQHIAADRGIVLSRPTLFRWYRLYRAGGLAALVDARGSAETVADDDPFLAYVKYLYLRLSKPKLSKCHQLACLKAQESGWEIRSYKSAQRFINSIPAPTLILKRDGKEAYTNLVEPYIVRDYTTLASNEIWCSDHHELDLFVKFEGRNVRPWLTAWQDLRSRKLVGWHLFCHDPSSDTILVALRNGIQSHGVPEIAYVDNGKDYDCHMLQGFTKIQRRKIGAVHIDPDRLAVFPALGVSLMHAWPYHGQSKPIERFFGTLGQSLVFWPSYCGGPGGRGSAPEDLYDKLKSGKAPEFSEFLAWFTEWIEAGYHNQLHSGDGLDGQLTPSQAFDQFLTAKRTIPAANLEALLVRRTKPILARQNGVTWQGLTYGQHSPELHELIGKKVTLAIDDRDLSQVAVYSVDGAFICRAEVNKSIGWGADAQTRRDAVKAKRHMIKLDREHAQQLPRMHDDMADMMIRAASARAAAAEAANPQPAPEAPNLIPVRTPIDDQVPAIQRAFEAPRRIAVGAESLTAPAASFQYTPTTKSASEEADDSHMSFAQFSRPSGKERDND